MKITHVPAPSASLRTKGPGTSVDVRLCRLRAKDPATAAPGPIRLPGDSRDPGRAIGVLLVVDERGRVEDEASLGSTEFLRAPTLGAPEARFLRDKNQQSGTNMGPRDMDYRFLITSVLRDSGLTTPCSFCGHELAGFAICR
jgi:hypothetical protein